MSARKQGGHLTVVPQPPAKPVARSLADFDNWLALGNKLSAHWCKLSHLLRRVKGQWGPPNRPYFETIETGDGELLMDGDGEPVQIECIPSERAKVVMAAWRLDKLTADVARFVKGWEVHNPAALYEPEDDYPRGHLRHDVICRQVALLLGAFPNAGPHAPETYTPLLIEEIVAADPDAIRLEAAMRRLRREKTFVPTIAEVLKAIAEVELPEDNDFETMADIIQTHKILEAALAALPAVPA